MKEELLGIFGQLLKGEQEINFTHTARQAKSRDIDENSKAHKCKIYNTFVLSRNMVAHQE